MRDFKENEMYVLAGLTTMYKLIIKFQRQVSSSHRGEAHRFEFSRKAVLSYRWVYEHLLRVATQSLSFQQLYGKQEASLQLIMEA